MEKEEKIKEKEESLKNSLIEIEKLKKLLLEKKEIPIKINNVDSSYLSNKDSSDKFYNISIEEEKAAVKQVSQKLERMYLDLNEKNSRIDFLIKKYRELEKKKNEKNCIIC